MVGGGKKRKKDQAAKVPKSKVLGPKEEGGRQTEQGEFGVQYAEGREIIGKNKTMKLDPRRGIIKKDAQTNFKGKEKPAARKGRRRGRQIKKK